MIYSLKKALAFYELFDPEEAKAARRELSVFMSGVSQQDPTVLVAIYGVKQPLIMQGVLVVCEGCKPVPVVVVEKI